MLYWPCESDTTVRTFSISAGLDASTVTPGKTAPDGSLTVPATVPSTCAAPTHGTLTSPRAKSRTGTCCRRTLRSGLRISLPPGCPPTAFGGTSHEHGGFRYANLFSLNGGCIRLERGGVKETGSGKWET